MVWIPQQKSQRGLIPPSSPTAEGKSNEGPGSPSQQISWQCWVQNSLEISKSNHTHNYFLILLKMQVLEQEGNVTITNYNQGSQSWSQAFLPSLGNRPGLWWLLISKPRSSSNLSVIFEKRMESHRQKNAHRAAQPFHLTDRLLSRKQTVHPRAPQKITRKRFLILLPGTRKVIRCHLFH